MNAEFSSRICWWLVSLTAANLQTIATPIKRRQTGAYEELATQFVLCLRTGDHSGPSFEAPFNEPYAEAIRATLEPSDSLLLLQIIKTSDSAPKLRNRAASLILHPSLRGDARAGIVRQLKDIYFSRKHLVALGSDEWVALRGIALALAHQEAYGECMYDYINRISTCADVEPQGEGRPSILERNLAQSDNYKIAPSRAFQKYMDTIRHRHAAEPGSCFWEMFYLSCRADEAAAPAVYYLLGDCNKYFENGKDMKALDHCQKCIQLLLKRYPAVEFAARPMITSVRRGLPEALFAKPTGL